VYYRRSQARLHQDENLQGALADAQKVLELAAQNPNDSTTEVENMKVQIL